MSHEVKKMYTRIAYMNRTTKTKDSSNIKGKDTIKINRIFFNEYFLRSVFQIKTMIYKKNIKLSSGNMTNTPISGRNCIKPYPIKSQITNKRYIRFSLFLSSNKSLNGITKRSQKLYLKIIKKKKIIF